MNETSKQFVESIYQKVYELTENGLTIRQALKYVSCSSAMFYRYISEKDKQLLKMIKASNSQTGNYSSYNNGKFK